MIFEFFLLLTVGSNCKSEHFQKLSEKGPSDVFQNYTESCDDIKHTFDKTHDSNLNEKSVILNMFQDFPQLVQDNEKLEEYNLSSEKFVFGNQAELLLGKVFEKIFIKLANLRNSKLNEVVLTLRKERPLSYEYLLLNAFDGFYNTRNNRGIEEEKLQKIRFPDENVANLLFDKKKTYYDYGYFDYLSEKELKGYAKCLICAFLTLANLTNNYYSVKELLLPLEIIIGDDKSSSAILIFINEFLTKAMEGNGYAVNIYRNLSMKYVINQLQTVDAFNVSELLSLQNKSDLEIRNNFENFKQLDPEGILTLALDWRFKMQDALNKSDISEYFHTMDETFREISENRNAKRIVNYRSLSANEMPNRAKLLSKIKKKINSVIKRGARVKRVLRHIKTVVVAPETSTTLLEFADEFLTQLNSSQRNLMQIVYNYMARELNTIEPFEVSVFEKIRDKKMEELAAIVNEHIMKKPRSIDAMALDWLFDLKIELLTGSKRSNVFDILKNTFKQAKERRKERLRKLSRTWKLSMGISKDSAGLAKRDKELLFKTINY